MKKIVVLGAGLVGSVIAKDLSKNHRVTSVDIDPSTAQKFLDFPEIRTIQADLADPAKIRDIVREFAQTGNTWTCQKRSYIGQCGHCSSSAARACYAHCEEK